MSRMRIGDEEVLTLQQASERIGVSHETLQKQVKRGVLRAELLGRQWVVTANELQRYAREHKGKPGFAAETHPFHGRRPPRKQRDE